MERYGVENVFQAEWCKDKSLKTILEKYGSLENFYKLQKEKLENFILEKYGSWENYNNLRYAKFKKTCMERYGVENVFQAEWCKEKCNTEETIKKSNITKFRKNKMVSINDELKELYYVYKMRVRRLSDKNFKKYESYINPLKYKRDSINYNLDHKLSILECFINNVNIEIASHPCNLRIISKIENNIKTYKSVISLEELNNLIKEFEQNEINK